MKRIRFFAIENLLVRCSKESNDGSDGYVRILNGEARVTPREMA